MKKKILSLALIAMSLVGSSAMAQSPSENNNSTVVTENVKQMKDGKKKMKGNRQRKNPYEGLTLTDSQKEKLQQLDSKRLEARKQKAEARKAEKQRNDSIMRANRKAEKMEYLEEVKAIVGPEQYVVFLENMYVNQDGGQKNFKAIQKGDRGNKQGFAHNKGNKDKKNKDGKHGKDMKAQKFSKDKKQS
ncbi:MAG: hypothetical protein K2H46_08840 [Muribaculaceae bacterium]|nr:hypothetical protein [Muribaculaceae bacterium]